MWELVNSPTINSRTSYITVSHICIIYAYTHVRSEANWKLETPTEPTRDTQSGAGSGLCELTNQGYSGGGALKRQELKETKPPIPQSQMKAGAVSCLCPVLKRYTHPSGDIELWVLKRGGRGLSSVSGSRKAESESGSVV